ncbi:YhgE/Pip domain-containing protein [Leucobacter luti]|uniref:Putative membrane protein n=1 Tax=Leucobacter luti TaxID=340320 RepID=A0A4Q7U3B0_9MICO|nr:YhgE/Pip family protein [Leucobacter luti]MBL3699378.1 YhgE/Pip domain-containing protein [Leucobacter luti]RZT66888.1 putative membrane protein [Leucobacter luti]
MSAALTRLSGRKPVRWTTLLGLILVPLTVAGVLLWGLWNPTERLDTVTAAVVNNDEAVEVDGQLVPLGRLLAGELIGEAGAKDDPDAETNFTWVLTDEEDAAAGLDDGRYATVVTIPEDFSAAATSLSGEPKDATQATIDIAESDRGRLIDTALSGIVTQTATQLLNQQLGEQFVGGVFVGMTELSKGIGSAADGATQLADGGTQLGEGATQLADGTQQLADGTQQLSSGAGELAAGAGSLAAGAGTLASGAGDLAGGAGALADGTRLFASGDGTAENPGIAGFSAGLSEYAIGARTLATGNGTAENPGLAGLATGVEAYTGGVNEALAGLQSGAGAAIDPLTQLRGAIEAELIPVENPQEAIAGLDLLIGTLQGAASSDPSSQIEQLKLSGVALAGGVRSAATGAEQAAGAAEQLAGAGTQLAAGAEGLAVGAAQLSGGAAGLAGGASELAGGASGLATGASGLATGTSELAANTPELADGAAQLADGVEQSAAGAAELAKGLGEAVSGIPNYTEAERDKLAETAVTPVKAEGGSDELFNASGVPLFAGIALWAGALAAFLVLAPLWRRTREAARGVGEITLRSALPALGLGAAQGAIAGVVLPIALGYDFAQGAGFFGLALLAGIAFTLLVQGLSALLGGFGRFIAFVLLVVAFAVGIVSTVPGPLAAVGELSPVGAALGGFQAIATGAAGAGGAAVLLTLWGLAGLVLTALAVRKERAAQR